MDQDTIHYSGAARTCTIESSLPENSNICDIMTFFPEINLFCFQFRGVMVYVSVNQYFDYLVMLTILANCAFLAMTEPINEAE